MYIMVCGQLQQQCHWEDVTQRVSISHDDDNGPITVYNGLQRPLLQYVGRPKIC